MARPSWGRKMSEKRDLCTINYVLCFVFVPRIIYMTTLWTYGVLMNKIDVLYIFSICVTPHSSL
jgi:hypothetical protein